MGDVVIILKVWSLETFYGLSSWIIFVECCKTSQHWFRCLVLSGNNYMFLVSSCSCFCPVHWSQVLSKKWRYSWSSTDRRWSKFIWVINNVIAYKGVAYIRALKVPHIRLIHPCHVWQNMMLYLEMIFKISWCSYIVYMIVSFDNNAVFCNTLCFILMLSWWH